ncbi:MAG: DsbA family oxidoreductase [Saprospiraceae bacterium]|nr:DsbA family oxidoreductase [Saprospiraceae bacterium]
MTVEIWSDIACPFCYIGKRRFERALAQFEGKNEVAVTWRSFQLDPTLETDPSISAVASLAEKKGWSLEQTHQAQAYVTQMAAGEGLAYYFDKQVVANTFDAHRLTHFAKQHGKQLEAEEAIFHAYFTEGKNIADHDALAEIGAAIGLDPVAVRAALASDAHVDGVGEDIQLAQQFGISSVPFFVFDRKYAVSGAQEVGAFLQVMERTQAATAG